MDERTVEIRFDYQTLLRRANSHCEARNAEVQKELNAAIGYLSTFAQGRYPIVKIYEDRSCGSCSLQATFMEADTFEAKYMVIGAVYDKSKGTYSFHS